METILAPLPLGTSDFSALRKSGQIYVDKTGLIYTRSAKNFSYLGPDASESRCCCLRLNLSSKYGLRDFHGLEIEALWKDESTYQVIRLDFESERLFLRRRI